MEKEINEKLVLFKSMCLAMLYISGVLSSISYNIINNYNIINGFKVFAVYILFGMLGTMLGAFIPYNAKCIYIICKCAKRVFLLLLLTIETAIFLLSFFVSFFVENNNILIVKLIFTTALYAFLWAFSYKIEEMLKKNNKKQLTNEKKEDLIMTIDNSEREANIARYEKISQYVPKADISITPDILVLQWNKRENRAYLYANTPAFISSVKSDIPEKVKEMCLDFGIYACGYEEEYKALDIAANVIRGRIGREFVYGLRHVFLETYVDCTAKSRAIETGRKKFPMVIRWSKIYNIAWAEPDYSSPVLTIENIGFAQRYCIQYGVLCCETYDKFSDLVSIAGGTIDEKSVRKAEFSATEHYGIYAASEEEYEDAEAETEM